MYKSITKWWEKRRNRFYRQRRLHLALEIALIAIILVLLAIVIWLPKYEPQLNGDPFYPDVASSSASDRNAKLNFEIAAEPIQAVITKSQPASWRINFKNTGSEKIDTVRINTDFASTAFKFSKIKIDGDQGNISDGVIMLDNIAVGDTASIIISADWEATRSDAPRSLIGKISATATTGGNRLLKEIDLPELRIESSVQFTAAVYYHSPQGDQLGLGPIPPIVGTPTKYWLIMKLKNEGNALRHVTVSFRLPRGVELSGEESLLAGKYSYNVDTRRVMWQIENISASGGDYIANFGLTFLPIPEQAGKDSLLVENIDYNADDSWTGTVVSGRVSDINTSLPDDRFNRGQGKVQAEIQ